jgi:hypothetical protein
MDYPFPEIYVAAGEVDTATGEGNEMLVDGQQRITTLFQYFTGSKELALDADVVPYSKLSESQKRSFLEYDVVVRDLGNVSITEIKEVFRRINSTRYALTAMEVHNARFEGEFKQFGDEMANEPFFQQHQVFSSTEIKRMSDTRYTLTIAATVMSDYFNRDDELEKFLIRYNDEFPEREKIGIELRRVFGFIDDCAFAPKSRAWKKNDLFTLIVEIHTSIIKERLKLNPLAVRDKLEEFYSKVDIQEGSGQDTDPDVQRYYLAAIQASNDRGNRVVRGDVVRKLFHEIMGQASLF